ncbi:hypothetical protein MPF_1958 [Methanohalophilus portucalensis FDF-1]|uniref:Uncharacterized protein n=1 Tax=Methanohalophilus portucalensis FDF-1 TaxID=523843 RepID=A0A1L9C242_9EURY|nr:hypothetical protein MPF_1958 [Methanohalophilus portucalensis FDF-1]
MFPLDVRCGDEGVHHVYPCVYTGVDILCKHPGKTADL